MRHKTVIISLHQGTAEVEECPPGCTVAIKDFDTEGCDPEALEADGSILYIAHGPFRKSLRERLNAVRAEGELRRRITTGRDPGVPYPPD